MEKRFCPYCMGAVEAGEPCPNCGLTAGAYNPLPHHLPPGTVLMDRYLVGRVLGEGGFGITYIGCDLRLELKVAIKEYFPTDKVTRHAMASLTVSSYIGAAASGYAAGKERFLNEARTMARMDKQPQIVSVRDFFEANNTAYIVMEYVEGTTFKELVSQKGGRIPPAELLPMMEPLFSALSAMHERGLIHRDISPDNLMLENGALRLLDFGCARESSRGTETMTIALKHGYAPIEQYQHKGQGPWTDVYGLSATIYYCLTGKTPPQALDRLCEDELILPRKLGVPLTERQEKALLYGMGIRPRRRFQSVEELHTALYEEQVPIPQPPETEPEQGLLEEPVREFVKVTPPQAEVNPGDKTVIEPLFEPAAVTEPAPEPEHPNTWQPEPQPVTAEQPAAMAVMEAEPAQEGSLLTRLTKNKKMLAIGGIAAAVVIAAVILLAVFLPSSTGPTADPGGTPTPPVTSPGPSDAPPSETDPFADPAYLTGNTETMGQELLDLMADNSVSSIVVPANMGSFGVPGDAVTITKPILVREGTELDFTGREVNVTGNGYLLIEGILAVDQAFIFSDGGRLEVAETGILAGSGLLWFQSEESFIFHGQALEMMENQLIFDDPEDLFADAAVVTTRAELLQKNSWGQPIVIASGAVIELVSEFGQQVPILIEEGAVVHSGENAAWVIDNALLINRGTLAGWVWTNNAKIINEGTLAPTEAFFLQEGSTLFNQPSGEVVLHSIPQFSVGTYTLNLGTITGHVQLMGGMMLNQGAIVNTEQDGFNVSPGSKFINRSYGTVDIYGNFWNDGHVFNGGGTITIHDGAGFDNCSFFENEGSLHLEQAGYVGNSGIVRWIAGNGYVDQPERLDHLIYDDSSRDWHDGLTVEKISTADELTAWARRGSNAATLTQDIAVEGELYITKGLDVPDGVTLTVDRLTVSGSTVRVGGVLYSHEVRVLDGALLHANGNISVRDGGLLELDGGGSMIYEGNDFDLSGSTLRLANGSDFYLAWAEHAVVSYVEALSDAHFLSLNGGVPEGAEVVIQGGQLLFPYGMGCYEMNLTIEDGGLRTNGLELETGSLTISGSLITHGNVRLGEGVTMVNHGQVNFGGYEDRHLVQVDGVIENHGTLAAGGLPIEVNGRLDNHGTLYYAWGGSITGNVTGDPAQPHPDF